MLVCDFRSDHYVSVSGGALHLHGFLLEGVLSGLSGELRFQVCASCLLVVSRSI